MNRKAKVGQLVVGEKRWDSKLVKKVPKYNKLVVFVAVVVATGLCTAQLCDILQRFFRRPVTNCVKIVKSNTFKVPAFVVCPKFDEEENETMSGFKSATSDSKYNDDFDFDKMLKIGSKLNTKFLKGDKKEADISGVRCANMSDCDSDDIGRFAAGVDDFWADSSIKVELDFNACRVAVDRDKCNGNNGKKGISVIRINSSKPTIFGGKCMIVTQVDDLYYSQRSKGLKLKITTSSKQQPSSIAMAFVDNLQSVAYDMSFESTIVTTTSQIIIFYIRKFKYLNTKNSPCLPNDEARKCTEDAMEDELVELELCNLPMLDSKRHPKNCSTSEEIDSNIAKLANWFLQGNVSKCPRKCDDGVVSFRQVDADETQRKSNGSFTIQLANNVLEEITEEYAYGSSALLSDIAGNVGFYLGISLIHIITQPLLFLKNRFNALN